MVWSPNHPIDAFEILLLVGSQWLDMNFHSLKSIVELIIVLPKQHYNNLKHSGQVAPDGVDWHNGFTYIGLLELWTGPLSHYQVSLCFPLTV